jgi:peptidoglycan/LPS O-acetylase OafA/YrhL
MILTHQPADKISSRIVFLDYMRIVAFLSVVISHKFFGEITQLSSLDNHVTIRSVGQLLFALTWGGLAGVIIFFLTSGYIITHVLRRETAGAFLLRRAFRIYPLYICAVLLEIGLATGMGNAPLPPLRDLIARLLLVGDFVGVENSIGGVEWTLRIEVLFYVFMAAIRVCGLMSREKFLPFLFLVVSVLLYKAPLFPSFAEWNLGYLNLFFPFLLMGSVIYLADFKKISKIHAGVVTMIMFGIHLVLMTKVHANWKESQYALIAVAIFLGAVALKQHFSDGKGVRLLSDLTYAIYLFHNWLWLYFVAALARRGVEGQLAIIFTILSLFLFCFFAHKLIENTAIKIGRRLTDSFNR